MHEAPSPLRKSPKGNRSLLYFPLLHQEWKLFHTEFSRILIDLSNTRETFFSGMECCKLMQLTAFLRFISKGIICILDGILKSLNLLEGMCDLTNTIKPPLLSVIPSICRLIILIYELIIGKRFIQVCFCYTQNINICIYYFI